MCFEQRALGAVALCTVYKILQRMTCACVTVAVCPVDVHADAAWSTRMLALFPCSTGVRIPCMHVYRSWI